MAADDGRVVSNFIVQALRGEDLTVYGEGQQTRSFCYVDDLIDGFIGFMKTPGFSGPLNLGNPSEFTVPELARAVLSLTGSKSRVVQASLPEDDPGLRRPDIGKARALFGFEPRVALEQGLSSTIEAFRRRLGGADASGLRTIARQNLHGARPVRGRAPLLEAKSGRRAQ